MKDVTVCTFAQRTPEWYAARLGRLTGSCAHKMLTTIKSGEAAARRDLRVRLVLERITGQSQESDFVSVDMQNGIDREADAFAYYEALTGNLMDRCGFLRHDTLMTGCSPDGFFGNFEGLVSIKCPKPATHLEYLKTQKVPIDYLRQLTHEMWLTGAQWTDFLSYQPQFPSDLRASLLRVEARSLDLAGYERELLAFLREVHEEVLTVQALRPKVEAA